MALPEEPGRAGAGVGCDEGGQWTTDWNGGGFSAARILFQQGGEGLRVGGFLRRSRVSQPWAGADTAARVPCRPVRRRRAVRPGFSERRNAGRVSPASDRRGPNDDPLRQAVARRL